MKKIIIIFCLVISGVNIKAQTITPGSAVTSETLSNGKLKTAITNYINANISKLNNLSYEGIAISFDLGNLSLLKSDGVWTNVVTCPELTVNNIQGNNEQREGVSFTLGFVIQNGIVLTHSISQTVNTKSEKALRFFDQDFVQIYKVNINETNRTIAVDNTGVLQNRAPGCGQSTMNCINHYYTNQGWFSVGLWVTTLFYPGTGVAVAAACGVTCCTNTGCPGN